MDTPPEKKTARPRRRKWVAIVTPLGVFAVGLLVAVVLIETAPKMKPTTPVHRATLVEVAPVEVAEQSVVVSALGIVDAARDVVLQPQVGGEILDVSPNFQPGGLFKAGETMLQIDPRDYELAVRMIERTLVQAESELRLEEGSQAVAAKEFELLGEVVTADDEDLVLRKPQLETARATVGAARAELDQAKLNLERATVNAPFNAVIDSIEVNTGARVTQQTALARIFGTDWYWIEASVPVDDLKWIRFPDDGNPQGSVVRIFDEAAWGAGVHRVGRVVRLAAGLEEEGRMARVIIALADPMALQPENKGEPVLLIGSYVRVEIEGRSVPDAVRLSREFVHDGTHVWVMDEAGALSVREVTIAYRSREDVLITGGIRAGERVVVSDLPAPVEGMPLRTAEADSSHGS